MVAGNYSRKVLKICFGYEEIKYNFVAPHLGKPPFRQPPHL